jgi:hypothetical protein
MSFQCIYNKSQQKSLWLHVITENKQKYAFLTHSHCRNVHLHGNQYHPYIYMVNPSVERDYMYIVHCTKTCPSRFSQNTQRIT